MNISIRTAVRLLLVVSAGFPLSAASAQQSGETPVLGSDIPILGSLEHTRNVSRGSTPASRAAEAAAAQAKAQRWQGDISSGETLMKAGDLDGAMGVFQQVLTYDPDNGLAYQRLAEAQTAAGRLNDAAASYRFLLYKQPGKNWSDVQNGDPVIHMQFALLLQRLNQRAEALSVYQRGYQLLQSEDAPSATSPAHGPLPPMLTSPDFTAAQLETAADTVIAIHKYDWVSQDLSIADFQHVLSIRPDSAVAYFYLGQIYKFRAGHGADAVQAFHKASQLGGSAMGPFVEKAQKEGLFEFTRAVPKVGEAAQ